MYKNAHYVRQITCQTYLICRESGRTGVLLKGAFLKYKR